MILKYYTEHDSDTRGEISGANEILRNFRLIWFWEGYPTSQKPQGS